MVEQIINLEEFMDRVQDDKELLFELLDIFIGDFQTKRKALEEAIGKRDFETVEHISHFLKGSCGNISVESLRAIFCKLEERGKKSDLEGVEEWLEDIDRGFEELVKHVGELRKKLQ